MSNKIDATLVFYRVLGLVALFLAFAPLLLCPFLATELGVVLRVCPILAVVVGIASAHGKMNAPAAFGAILGALEAFGFYALQQFSD